MHAGCRGRDALAAAFAEYVNGAGFVDADGKALTLEESTEGIYQAGTYYDYMKSVIEESLNNFLGDTTFPYDASSSTTGGFGGGVGGRGDFGDGTPPDGNGPNGDFDNQGDFAGGPDGNTDDTNNTSDQEMSFEDMDDIQRTDTSDSGLSLSGTYKTVWGQGHTQAERTGSSTENFIAWVQECTA